MTCKYSLMCFLLLFFTYATVGQEGQQAAESKPDRAAPAQAPAEVDEASTIDKASFVFGYNFITRLKNQGADFNFDQIIAGLNAANEGKESGMTPEEQRSVLTSWQKIMRAKAARIRKEQADKNTAEGEVAMAEFAKQEGATELEDGVMYVIVKDGDGAIPEKPDNVKINYKGMYTNGEVFDSTEKKGQPLVNPVMRFVPGFSSAVQAMKVGSKWKVFIRGDKAYGMRPVNREMGPNRALIFELELLEIMPIN